MQAIQQLIVDADGRVTRGDSQRLKKEQRPTDGRKITIHSLENEFPTARIRMLYRFVKPLPP
jgi:hypothetical protein